MECDNTGTLFNMTTRTHSGLSAGSEALTAIPICCGSFFVLYNSMHCSYFLVLLAIFKERVRNNFRLLEGARHKRFTDILVVGFAL
jgi:hypothetical protein